MPRSRRNADAKIAKRILSSKEVKVISAELEFESILTLRIVGAMLPAELGRPDVKLPDLALPWAVAINNRIDREGAVRTTLKGSWLKMLAELGLVKLGPGVGGGFRQVDFSPLPGIVQPLIDSIGPKLPEMLAKAKEEVEERARKIDAMVERTAANSPLTQKMLAEVVGGLSN